MYQALYRKWRPKSFDDVVGQPQITETLKKQVATGRLSHAYLFIGTRGTGKTTCAKILAKAVNCENPVNGNPCNQCPACRGIEDGSVMDVVELDAASNNGVDNVRALRDEAVFSPASVKKRVYIIDEVHMLSISAFNALLKILEEPPEHLLFILATTELQKVPATILSRCQRHSFRRLDADTVAARLLYVAQQEQLPLQPEAAALLGRLADGAMRDGLSLLDQCASLPVIDTDGVLQALGLAGSLHILELLRRIRAGETAGALAQFSALWQAGKDPATLLNELSTLLRDTLLLRVSGKAGAALCSGAYDTEALTPLAAQLSTEELLWQLETIQKSLRDMHTSSQGSRTIAELCLVRLCEPALGGGLAALESRVARLEQGALPVVQRPAATVAAVSAPVAPAPIVPAAPPEEAPEDMPPPPTDEDLPPWEMDEPPAPPAAAPEPRPQPASAPKPEPIPEAIPEPESEADFAPTAPLSPPPEGTGSDWKAFLDKAIKDLPPSLSMIVSDDYQCKGEVLPGELRLYAQNKFSRGILEKGREELRKLAEALTGRPMQVKFAEGIAPAPQPTGSGTAEPDPLESLMKFENVTIV